LAQDVALAMLNVTYLPGPDQNVVTATRSYGPLRKSRRCLMALLVPG